MICTKITFSQKVIISKRKFPKIIAPAFVQNRKSMIFMVFRFLINAGAIIFRNFSFEIMSFCEKVISVQITVGRILLRIQNWMRPRCGPHATLSKNDRFERLEGRIGPHQGRIHTQGNSASFVRKSRNFCFSNSESYKPT